MTPELLTERLVLRLPRKDDAEAIARYLNDFGVSGNLARVPYPYVLTDAEAWLRSRRPGLPPAETSFAIDGDGATSIGAVGFHQGIEGTILGYWLGRPHWGAGIMSEAARAAVDWFFSACDAHTLRSGAFAFNAASLAIQSKLGFTQIGHSRMQCLARGAELEHIDTELTRSVWKATR
jgi:RimJ/RimL family protein N-acetyltransferase